MKSQGSKPEPAPSVPVKVPPKMIDIVMDNVNVSLFDDETRPFFNIAFDQFSVRIRFDAHGGKKIFIRGDQLKSNALFWSKKLTKDELHRHQFSLITDRNFGVLDFDEINNPEYFPGKDSKCSIGSQNLKHGPFYNLGDENKFTIDLDMPISGEKVIDIKMENLVVNLILKTFMKFGGFFSMPPEISIMTQIHPTRTFQTQSTVLVKTSKINISLKNTICTLPTGLRADNLLCLVFPEIQIQKGTYGMYQTDLMLKLMEDY